MSAPSCPLFLLCEEVGAGQDTPQTSAACCRYPILRGVPPSLCSGQALLCAPCRRPSADPQPCSERGPYCVDENTERRNHYLDLAGIENYTSRFGPGMSWRPPWARGPGCGCLLKVLLPAALSAGGPCPAPPGTQVLPQLPVGRDCLLATCWCCPKARRAPRPAVCVWQGEYLVQSEIEDVGSAFRKTLPWGEKSVF